MTVKHNLNEQLLMGYAAGILPEAFDLVVATHLSLSDESRAMLAGYEAIGGGLLDNEDQADMSPDALAHTIARISDVSPVYEKQKVEGIFPEPLQAYVGGDLDKVKWKRLGGGIRQAILPTSKDASVRLLYIPAGMAVPDHSHRGLELTLVLQGAFADEVDVFKRGDIEIANEDLEHTPCAQDGLPCICLAATDAPLRFRGLLPRLLQPFAKI